MKEMTSKERVIISLNHEEPDRVPLDLGSLVSTVEHAAYKDLKKYLGIKSETKLFVRDHVDPPEGLLRRFEIDTRYVRIKSSSSFKVKLEPDNSHLDEWGTRWKKPESSLYWDPVDYPLKNATFDDLESYSWPNPDNPGRTEGLREEARRLRDQTDYAIVADVPLLGTFEHIWTCLRGSQFFLDMSENKSFAMALMERVTDFEVKLFKNYLNAVGEFIDVIIVSEDLGTQDNLLISPDMYRGMIKPFHKKVWQTIKENTDAKLLLHSCGSIVKLIPDLIELGVDALNPIQVSARDMDSKKLKEQFGDKLAFWGSIDTQHVLPNGSPADVEAEVKKRISDLAPGGGYILTAVHNIQAGVKPENICMMYDAARKYGSYPLSL